VSDIKRNLDDIFDEYNDDIEKDESIESEDEEFNSEEEDEEDDSLKDEEAKDKALLEKHIDNIMPINLSNCMKDSFLSYAMSVIVARALPDVRDGLKPVQRRILYTMGDLGVYSDKPHKKSARIVGDVMGKYHPHGDTAIYEAMVRMAQNFSYRNCLVDGHGNFGSIDGDGAAAMRYTEARLTKIAAELLKDMNKNTVNFVDNYDGSEKEPEVLPSKFPNLLVNGASGIAVGMATNIPTHNLGEVIDGTLALLHNPNIEISELMNYIPAPDFPTGGKIIGLEGIKKAYETGNGTVTCRAKIDIHELSNGKKEILIKEIPYQVNKARLIERIAELAKDKVIEGITDLRDESTRKGMKIVIETSRTANENVILNNLYKFTSLQTTYSVNMIALDHGQPKCLNLKQILECYIRHQIEVVTRRTEFDLKRAEARLHIVEGLLIALASIDDVVKTIKESKTTEQAITNLINNFKLSEIQAKAILDMKLQRLTGLELEKLQSEAKDLTEIINYLRDLLSSSEKIKGVIADELTEIKNKYADKRKTEIDEEEASEVEDEDLILVEDVIITITNKGYAKRLPVDTYKVQRRGGKGITGAKVQEEDFVEKIIYTSTHDHILFFTNYGKVYSIKAYQIPVASRIAKGLPVVNLLKLESGEKLTAVINIKSLDEEGYLIFATKNGNVKKTEINKFGNIRSSGIKAIILNEGDELIEVLKGTGQGSIIIGASNGKAVRFTEDKVRPSNRASQGVKAIKLEENEVVIGMILVQSDKDQIFVLSENGCGKRTNAAAFRDKGRAGKGIKYLSITEKTGLPVALKRCQDTDDLIVITDRGMIIRTRISDISVIGRDTQGVYVIKLNEGQHVAATTIVASDAE